MPMSDGEYGVPSGWRGQPPWFKVGDKVLPSGVGACPFVHTVTEITERGFKYTHAPWNLGYRIGTTEAGETYEPVGYYLTTDVVARLRHLERYEWIKSSDDCNAMLTVREARRVLAELTELQQRVDFAATALGVVERRRDQLRAEVTRLQEIVAELKQYA